MDQLTIKSYDADAAGFCEQYESAETADLHGLLRRYVTAGDRVLDVGCGSGRDALFMKNLGGAVTAVDGSAAMLQEAEKRHPELAGHLHHAALPLTSNHELLHEKFDVFACLAFLMHVPDEDLFELAFQVKQLLNTDGLLIVSVSTQRPGLSDDRDNRGRLFRERAPGEIQLLFERLGFRLLEHRTSGDGMGREIVWSHLVFNLADETGKGPVDQIETVINRDKKDATYKLALLRALCDIAQTEYRQAQWSVDDTVSVPLGLIAEKWLFYYWPLIEPDLDHQTVVIPQKRGLEINKPIAFRAPVLALVAHCCKHGGMDTFFHEYRHGTLEGKTAALADEALNRISNTIITGPVQYAGGALDGSDRFFWRSGGITRRRKCVSSRGTIEALGRVHMRGDIWRELSLLGHWIGEALILRWAELTHEISKHTVPVSKTIERLLIYPDNERDQDRVKSFYRELPSLNCVWTNQPLKNKFDVDHLIPFSLWHNNDFWNLLPTDPRVNNQKRDKLVGRQTLMNQRHTIMGY